MIQISIFTFFRMWTDAVPGIAAESPWSLDERFRSSEGSGNWRYVANVATLLCRADVDGIEEICLLLRSQSIHKLAIMCAIRFGGISDLHKRTVMYSVICNIFRPYFVVQLHSALHMSVCLSLQLPNALQLLSKQSDNPRMFQHTEKFSLCGRFEDRTEAIFMQ